MQPFLESLIYDKFKLVMNALFIYYFQQCLLLVNSNDKSNERGEVEPSSKVSQKHRYVSELPQCKEWKVSVVMILVFSCRSIRSLKFVSG